MDTGIFARELEESELTGLLELCAEALNNYGLGAGQTVASRIAGNDKLCHVLTAFGASDPAFPSKCAHEQLVWGIAALLDGMQYSA